MKRIVVIAGTVAVAGVVGLGAAAAYADPGQTPSPRPTDLKRHVGIGLPWIAIPALPGALPRLIGQVLYGETAVQADDGSVKAFDWQNGQVTAIAGAAVTVRSSDGTTWTWTLTGDTRVRKNDEGASPSDVATGDKVAITGTRSGSTRTAALVLDPPPDRAEILQRLRDLRKDPPKLRHDVPRLRRNPQRPTPTPSPSA